jgi:uncharacterized protein with ACT and thioredoxin-like domain
MSNTKEFNLSEKIAYTEDYVLKNSEKDVHPAVVMEVLEVEDVKEFIKRLKEELFKCDAVNNEEPVFNIIDKLAGDKLLEDKK